jgi:hypothetical protein
MQVGPCTSDFPDIPAQEGATRLVMAGIEKDHWLWNTRANDTGSIVECYSWFIESVAERRIYGLRHNYSTYYRSCVYVLLRVLDATA